MSWQEWLTIAVILATVVILVRDLLPPAHAILGATTILLVSRLGAAPPSVSRKSGIVGIIAAIVILVPIAWPF